MPANARLDPGLHRRLVDSLYVEAMVMADEARSYFDTGEKAEPTLTDPLKRVAFTCESLKVTTRLMHIIAWLLTQRAWQRGEISAAEMFSDKYQLGHAMMSDPGLIASFPFAARALISASEELYDRVARLQDRMLRSWQNDAVPEAVAVHQLFERLQTAF
jgi:regulator of CtrA degradation